jgi:hypothetical protein
MLIAAILARRHYEREDDLPCRPHILGRSAFLLYAARKLEVAAKMLQWHIRLPDFPPQQHHSQPPLPSNFLHDIHPPQPPSSNIVSSRRESSHPLHNINDIVAKMISKGVTVFNTFVVSPTTDSLAITFVMAITLAPSLALAAPFETHGSVIRKPSDAADHHQWHVVDGFAITYPSNPPRTYTYNANFTDQMPGWQPSWTTRDEGRGVESAVSNVFARSGSNGVVRSSLHGTACS